MTTLIDPAGRCISKLRVSLTEACNFRCFYCMPNAPKFAPLKDLLQAEELLSICAALVECGIRQIRLTGGEPTLRQDLVEITRGLSRLPIERLGMTSNGLRLAALLPELAAVGLKNLNLSLDSLDAGVFREITGSSGHAEVLEALGTAKSLGLEVKLNVVLFRGINSQELPAFARFARDEGVTVRFLELMKIGPRHEENQRLFISAAEQIEALRLAGLVLKPLPGAVDATAFEYELEGGGRIGFIASESRPFCSGCSRLRLSAKGRLRACLMKDDGLELRGRSASEYPRLLSQVMALKPVERLDHVDQPMVQIGG